MPITLNGTTGITTDGGYTGDGVSFADNTPANTLVTTTSGNVGIGTSSPTQRLDVRGIATGLEVGAFISNEASSTANNRSTLWFGTWGGASTTNIYNAKISAVNTNAINAATDLTFWTYNGSGSANGVQERARIDSSGNLLVGTTSVAANARMTVSFPGGSGSSRGLVMVSGSTASTAMVAFQNPNGYAQGEILTSGTTTSYTTSSDYRLKENVQPMAGALAKVQALKPCTYKWKVDGSDGEGFIAHELQEVVPQCVTGEKDAVDADGKPVYQGIDTSFLVATLTAAIQELKAELDTVKAELAELKGQA